MVGDIDMPFPFDNSYASLPEAFFAPANPSPVSDPAFIALNRELALDLRIDPDKLDSPEGLAYLAGNQVPDGAQPIAMAYSGHQFGGFNPQLGDGRATLLGEVLDKKGIRRDIQLKGSGPTHFSRRGDGLSALGPVIREYLVSEAMHALGVPTTRALAAVWSGDQVRRETMEPGGVFTRVASSHIRVGTFQYFAARQDHENLKVLADYVIDRHYPASRDSENPYRAMLEAVIERQANLIAHWMSFGFIHGVMNTDNMAVSGETIDYGPCAFLDDYDPAKKFSYIDQGGRYAFGNQSKMAHWNVTRLAEAILPLLGKAEDEAVKEAEGALDSFPDTFQNAFQKRFTSKIGIAEEVEGDWELVQSLLSLMHSNKADFTLTFRHLRDAVGDGNDQALVSLFDKQEAIREWLGQWRLRIQKEDVGTENARDLMMKVNPVFVPRNHRVEEAIQAGMKKDFEPFHRLDKVLRNPFEEQAEFADYEAAPKADEIVCTTFCGT